MTVPNPNTIYRNQYTDDPRQVERVCNNCNARFHTYRSLTRNHDRPYCSRACYHAFRQVVCKCARCGRKFTLPRSHAGVKGQGKFCSRACKRTPELLKRQIKTAATLRSRARKKNAKGYATVEQIAWRIAMWGGMCYLCKIAVATTLDHVIPLMRGGTNWPANLRPACLPCNLRKRTRPLADVLAQMAQS